MDGLLVDEDIILAILLVEISGTKALTESFTIYNIRNSKTSPTSHTKFLNIVMMLP